VLRRIRRSIVVLFAVVGLAGAVIVATPAAEYLAAPLRLEPELRPAEAIVVLAGGAFRDDVPSISSMARAVYGYTLYRARYAPRLLLSGGRVRSGTGWEALSMKRMLEGIGAPSSALLLEERSTRTYGNALESARLLLPKGVKRILLVTHPNHMWRAKRTFEKAGFTVLPAPIPWERMDRERPVAVSRIGLFYSVLYEYGGIALYWWRGWL
jgi:uncharacterized SAM-binding protein YcdF (DUF218 family)